MDNVPMGPWERVHALRVLYAQSGPVWGCFSQCPADLVYGQRVPYDIFSAELAYGATRDHSEEDSSAGADVLTRRLIGHVCTGIPLARRID
eukprot:2871373-Rhodomonas_salina.1